MTNTGIDDSCICEKFYGNIWQDQEKNTNTNDRYGFHFLSSDIIKGTTYYT